MREKIHERFEHGQYAPSFREIRARKFFSNFEHPLPSSACKCKDLNDECMARGCVCSCVVLFEAAFFLCLFICSHSLLYSIPLDKTCFTQIEVQWYQSKMNANCPTHIYNSTDERAKHTWHVSWRYRSHCRSNKIILWKRGQSIDKIDAIQTTMHTNLLLQVQLMKGMPWRMIARAQKTCRWNSQIEQITYATLTLPWLIKLRKPK